MRHILLTAYIILLRFFFFFWIQNFPPSTFPLFWFFFFKVKLIEKRTHGLVWRILFSRFWRNTMRTTAYGEMALFFSFLMLLTALPEGLRVTRTRCIRVAEETENVCNINYSWRTDEDYGCEKTKNANASNWGLFAWLVFTSIYLLLTSRIAKYVYEQFSWIVRFMSQCLLIMLIVHIVGILQVLLVSIEFCINKKV